MHVHPRVHMHGSDHRIKEDSQHMSTYNGIAASELNDVAWQKSRRSNSRGSCVEFAKLSDGSIAMRNSRFPTGPALVYTQDEIDCLILGAKDGDFDNLLG